MLILSWVYPANLRRYRGFIMFQTVTFSDFRSAFRAYSRTKNFSYTGLELLFDYMEEMGNVELDVIALCCEYSEDTASDIVDTYSIDIPDDAEMVSIVREYLEENTSLIGVHSQDVFVYAQF